MAEDLTIESFKAALEKFKTLTRHINPMEYNRVFMTPTHFVYPLPKEED